MDANGSGNLLIHFLGRVRDLVVLNILVLVTSIPVITAGASLTAMYYVMQKMIRGEEGYVVRQFFQSFKENLKQATVMWLPFLAVGALVLLDLRLLNVGGTAIPAVFGYLIIAAALIIFYISLYAFPLLARFRNTVRGTLRNAARLWLYAFPRTVLMAVLTFFPFVMVFLEFKFLIFLLLCGISLPGYLCTMIRLPVFQKLETAREDAPGGR